MFQVNYVEPVLLGYAFCLFVTVSLEQQLIYRKTCIQHFNSTYCQTLYKSRNPTFKANQDFIQKETSQWIVYISVARAIPSILITLLYTVKFDRVGRKRIMILPIIGGTILVASYIINSHFMEWPVPWMFLGIFLDASFGQYPTLLAAVFAYLADTTSNENRTIRVIILESMLFLGGLISEITNGLLLQNYGFLPPFILMLSVYILVIIYWFFLKESYTPDRGEGKRTFFQELKKKLWNDVGSMFFKQKDGRKQKRIFLLVVSFLLAIYRKLQYKTK